MDVNSSCIEAFPPQDQNNWQVRDRQEAQTAVPNIRWNPITIISRLYDVSLAENAKRTTMQTWTYVRLVLRLQRAFD